MKITLKVFILAHTQSPKSTILTSFLPYQNSPDIRSCSDTIKIMPCVEGDRSDCQPEASSIARSRRLRAMVVVEG